MISWRLDLMTAMCAGIHRYRYRNRNRACEPSFIAGAVTLEPLHGKDAMPTKYCPHCGQRTGFEVRFNVSCRVDDRDEPGCLALFAKTGGTG
jgi:hypothetical protein